MCFNLRDSIFKLIIAVGYDNMKLVRIAINKLNIPELQPFPIVEVAPLTKGTERD